MNKPLIVYIIGDSRSGSTLLDYLLASHPEAFSVGEVHHLHGYYYKQGVGKSNEWRCSCGQHIENCKFWSDILKKVSFNKNFETIINRPKTGFLRKLNNFLFLKKRLNDKTINENGRGVAENRWKIYKAVAEKTKKNIIIDSSKNAEEAYFINKYRKGEIRFILLDRDIHEVALSKKKRIKEMKAFYELKNQSLYKIILFSYKVFRENHSVLKAIEKSTKKKVTKTIDYVRLTANPEKEIIEICDFLNISEFKVPKETNIYKYPPHILGGSPSRYKRRTIQPDKRWKNYYKKKKVAFALSRLLHKL